MIQPQEAAVSDGAPTLIAIDHDDHHATHVGRTDDGRQFFLTTPFIPARGTNAGSEFVALYQFDAAGRLVDFAIDDLGPRATMNVEASRQLLDRRLRELGSVTFGRVEVAPFAVERFGTTFGLIPRPPEDEDGQWVVESQPGNYMAFFEPWDSGEYDT